MPCHRTGRGGRCTCFLLFPCSAAPLVAITTVVSTPATTVWIMHDSFSAAETCCHNRAISLASFSKEVSRLAAAPRRPSTYHDRWLHFADWATGKGFDPLGPTAAQIAAFLNELFDTHGLSPQTIKGYRACLATVLSRTGRAAEVQAKTISDMIMSMELQRPRLTPVLPQWTWELF